MKGHNKDEAPSIASPQELLALLQQDGSDQQPALQDLMSAVERMQQGQPAARADADQVLVFPEPGFVIKTQDEQGSKVFINVCGSDKVAMPGGWAGSKVPEDVKRHLEGIQGPSSSQKLGDDDEGSGAGEAAELLRFPISMGQPRADQDLKGLRCTVIDCIFNDELLRMASTYRPLKVYIISLVLTWAQQKNGLSLDPHYKLPKMRYKGDSPPPQYVRQDKPQQAQPQRLISEVEDDSPAFALRAEAPPKATSKAGGGKSSKAATAQQEKAGAGAGAQAAGWAAAQQNDISAGAKPAATATAATKAGGAGASAASGAKQAGEAAAAAAARGGGRPSQEQGGQLQYTLEYIGRPVVAVQLAVQLPPQAVQSVLDSSDAPLDRHSAAAQQQQWEPGAASIAGVAVDVAGHSMHVVIPGYPELTVQLPFAVAAEGGSAQLDRSKGQLLLHLQHIPFRDVYNQLMQTAPGRGAASGLTTSSLLDVD